jgi:hypothetical protein
MNLGVLIAGALGILSAWALVYPHLRAQEESKNQMRADTLEEEKNRLLQILRDLELDKDTQKISDEEFAVMNQRIRAELGQVFERLANESNLKS